MATKEFWIQIENRAWDVAPNNIARMTGQTQQQITGNAPVVKTITSPETGVVRNVTMYRPLDEDALILRRYTQNWAAPDDRKVNPWDLNEPNPTDSGTMGTIPGATIECNVGDKVIVHFRNKDFRQGKDVKARTHSLHPHGIVFAPTYDGAYPLSPADPTQPIPAAEAATWASVGVTGLKKGDRVPPDGTFTYIWDTFGWPTTSGVWHYHDHSICDVENVTLGAIAFLVIHNPEDPDDVIQQDLPDGDPNGSLVDLRCFPFPVPVPTLPTDLERLRLAKRTPRGLQLTSPLESGEAMAAMMEISSTEDEYQDPNQQEERPKNDDETEAEKEQPTSAFVLERDDMLFELDLRLRAINQICLPFYRDPPERAQYLQYYHELPGVGMTINGRKYLGNTPTLIGGLNTKMRFGLAAMNSLAFHTFHLHGHRWVIPGPQGNNPNDIQGSPQVQAVSQFEDTRTFGPANSFSFTINQGTFMGSVRPPAAPGLGEWHMHCHVLNHMMPGGMMGSLLVIQGGELALFLLPRGELCPTEEVPLNTVLVDDFAFTPNTLTVAAGSLVTFEFQEANHTVRTVSRTNADPITINNGGGDLDAVPVGQAKTVTINGSSGGEINYECGIHGSSMSGKIVIS